MSDANSRDYWTWLGDELGYTSGSCSFTEAESVMWGNLAKAAYAVARAWDDETARASSIAAFRALDDRRPRREAP